MRPDKSELIHKLKQLEGITQEERSYLIDLVNTKKKYGLVWEDKPEEAAELLRGQLPVLKEVVERRILSSSEFTELQNLQDKKLLPNQLPCSPIWKIRRIKTITQITVQTLLPPTISSSKATTSMR